MLCRPERDGSMAYRIEKDFTFSAAHQLSGLPDDHPCSRIHGHNYVVRIRLESMYLNQIGFVRDYRELDDVKSWIDATLDHRNLNDVWTEMNPTAENIARAIFDRFASDYPQLSGVGVSETPKTWAWFE